MTRPEPNMRDRTKHGRYEQYTTPRLKFQLKNGTLRDRKKCFSIRGAIIYLPYNDTTYGVQCAVQVILTLTIRWAMRCDSFMENKNICASHPQVDPACYHFSNSNIAVVVKDIRNCTTHIIGHANHILSYSLQHFFYPYLNRTAVLGSFLPTGSSSPTWTTSGIGDVSTSPPLLRPLHFPLIFAPRWQQLRLYSARKEWGCSFLLTILFTSSFSLFFLAYLLMETQRIALPWFLPLCDAYFWGILLKWFFETCFQSILVCLMDKCVPFGHRSSQPPRVWYSEIWGLVLANGGPFLCSSLVSNLAFQGTIWILILCTSRLAFRIFIL